MPPERPADLFGVGPPHGQGIAVDGAIAQPIPAPGAGLVRAVGWAGVALWVEEHAHDHVVEQIGEGACQALLGNADGGTGEGLSHGARTVRELTLERGRHTRTPVMRRNAGDLNHSGTAVRGHCRQNDQPDLFFRIFRLKLQNVCKIAQLGYTPALCVPSPIFSIGSWLSTPPTVRRCKLAL